MLRQLTIARMRVVLVRSLRDAALMAPPLVGEAPPRQANLSLL
jgi:hypothetical protein